MTRPRKTLRREDVTVAVDTREQLAWDLAPMRMVRKGLVTGDYTVVGYEDLIAVERKSLADFVMCSGRERERFFKCCHRMRAYEHHALVIEASLADLYKGGWRGLMKPSQVVAVHNALVVGGLRVILAGSREAAAKVVGDFLFAAARRRWNQDQRFLGTLRIVGSPEGVPEPSDDQAEAV